MNLNIYGDFQICISVPLNVWVGSEYASENYLFISWFKKKKKKSPELTKFRVFYLSHKFFLDTEANADSY